MRLQWKPDVDPNGIDRTMASPSKPGLTRKGVKIGIMAADHETGAVLQVKHNYVRVRNGWVADWRRGHARRGRKVVT